MLNQPAPADAPSTRTVHAVCTASSLTESRRQYGAAAHPRSSYIQARDGSLSSRHCPGGCTPRRPPSLSSLCAPDGDIQRRRPTSTPDVRNPPAIRPAQAGTDPVPALARHPKATFRLPPPASRLPPPPSRLRPTSHQFGRAERTSHQFGMHISIQNGQKNALTDGESHKQPELMGSREENGAAQDRPELANVNAGA